MLKTLKQHDNEQMRLTRRFPDEPVLNGIECPDCGAELLDSTPDIVIASTPHKYNIHCASCAYRGYRL